MRTRSLSSYYSLKPYRVCPDCGTKYTADQKTKQRQVPIIILTSIVLGLSIAVGLMGVTWLLPAMMSHIVLWSYVGYTVSKVVYVQYLD